MIRLSAEKKLLRYFYSFKRVYCRPRRLSMEELETEIENLRVSPVSYSIRNVVTNEFVMFRKVMFTLSSSRSRRNLILLSDGSLKEVSDRYNTFEGSYMSEDEKFHKIKSDLYENEEMSLSNMSFQLLMMEQGCEEGTLLDIASKVIATSAMIAFPPLHDYDILKLLSARECPLFLDRNLRDNEIELVMTVKFAPTYIRYANRRDNSQEREDGLLDNMIFSSVCYRIKSQFTLEEIIHMEYDQILGDVRMRPTIRELIADWIENDSERERR